MFAEGVECPMTDGFNELGGVLVRTMPNSLRPTPSAELRKSLPKEVTKGVGPLLKAYQEEIDRLTQR